MSVYKKLDEIMQDQEVLGTILPLITQQLPRDAKDMQLCAAEGFLKAFKSARFVDTQTNLMDLFLLCLTILEQWNTEVIDEWVKIFEFLLSKLNYSNIEEKLKDTIIALSKTSQPVQSRYAAVKIIASTAKLKGALIEGKIFDRAIHLCGDYEKSVRLALASGAIEMIFGAVRSNVCRNIMFEKVLELVYDPDEDVKICSILMVVQLLDQIDEEDNKRQKIANLYMELLSSVHNPIIATVSGCLARMVVKVNLKSFKFFLSKSHFLNFFLFFSLFVKFDQFL